MTALLNRAASPASALVCRNYSAQYPLAAQHTCFECWGPLEIGYDPGALARVTHEDVAAGPQSIWRYLGLLPVGHDEATRVDSGTGMTPLIRADRLADELGFTAPVWIKDDSANPTHSFKDRVVSIAMTAARELGFERIACASTGNLANSVASHAARIGMPSIVFVPSDLEPAKIVQTAVYGQTLVAVEGSYDDVNRLRQRQRSALLRRGIQDARLRGRRAARLAAAPTVRGPDGVRLDADQDPQGVQRASHSGPGASRRVE